MARIVIGETGRHGIETTCSIVTCMHITAAVTMTTINDQPIMTSVVQVGNAHVLPCDIAGTFTKEPDSSSYTYDMTNGSVCGSLAIGSQTASCGGSSPCKRVQLLVTSARCVRDSRSVAIELSTKHNVLSSLLRIKESKREFQSEERLQKNYLMWVRERIFSVHSWLIDIIEYQIHKIIILIVRIVEKKRT